MKTIFLFDSYKDFTREFLENSSHKQRGKRIQLAKFLECQPAFISQVLNGNLHFSLEQAEAASRYMGLSPLEKKFFLNLLQLERAGTSQLKAFLTGENALIKQEAAKLTERLVTRDHLTEKQQVKYYSHWYFAAIHVLVTIPTLQDSETLAQRLNLDHHIVREALQFLEQVGLIESKKGRITATKKTNSPRRKLALDRATPY